MNGFFIAKQMYRSADLEVGETALAVPIDHDRGGGGKGGVHPSTTAHIEGAELLTGFYVQGSLVDLEFWIRVSLDTNRKLRVIVS